MQMSPDEEEDMEPDEEEDVEHAVMEQMSRHADRLIALAPDNPASHEIKAYVVLSQQTHAASVGLVLQAAK